MPFHLLRTEDPNSGLRRIAQEQIDIAINGFSVESMPLDKQVHSLRARCKKMRGLIRLIRPMLGDDVYKEQDRMYRTAGKELAGARDTDVALKTMASLGGGRAEDSEQASIPAEAIAHSLTILSACREAVGSWPLDVISFDDIAPGFARTYQKCLDAWSAVKLDPTDINYHRLRKNAKYHWYHVRILERINKKKIHKGRHRLRDLQLVLGDAHDLAMLQTYLEARDDRDLTLLERAIARKHELYEQGAMLAEEVFSKSADELATDYCRWWQESREKS